MQLQGKFVAASVPAVTAVLILLGWIVYSQLLSSRNDALDSEVALAADRVDVRFDAYTQELESFVGLLADSAPIVDWFHKSDSHFFGPRIRSEVISLFERTQAKRPQIQGLRLVDHQGLERLKVAGDESYPNVHGEFQRDWFAQANLNWWTRTHVFIGKQERTAETVLTIAAQVNGRDNLDVQNRGSAILGYVAIDVPGEVMARSVSSKAVGNNGYVVLMDETSDFIHLPAVHRKDAEAVQAALQANELTPSYRGETVRIEVNGQTRIVRQRMLTEGLTALIVLPATTLQAVQRQVATSVAVVTLVAIAGFSMFFSWLVYRVVVAPVSRLQDHVTAMSDGRPQQRLHLERDDEIGQLARAFSEMRQQLAESMLQLQVTSQHNEQLANHDGLTGLPNRRHFQRMLDDAVDEASETGESFAVMFFDLNKFKTLNDTLGHQAGDDLLVTTAQRLKASLDLLRSWKRLHNTRLDSAAARLSGDEFVVLICGFDSHEVLGEAADQLLFDLCREVSIDGVSWPLEASAGLAVYPEHALTASELLAHADQAMYAAKREGIVCWRLFQLANVTDSDGDDLLQDRVA